MNLVIDPDPLVPTFRRGERNNNSDVVFLPDLFDNCSLLLKQSLSFLSPSLSLLGVGSVVRMRETPWCACLGSGSVGCGSRNLVHSCASVQQRVVLLRLAKIAADR